MLVFGVVGYVQEAQVPARRRWCSRSVLGDMAETAFRQSMLLSGGSTAIFFSNPLVGSIVSLALILLCWPLVGIVLDRRARGVGRAGAACGCVGFGRWRCRSPALPDLLPAPRGEGQRRVVGWTTLAPHRARELLRVKATGRAGSGVEPMRSRRGPDLLPREPSPQRLLLHLPHRVARQLGDEEHALRHLELAISPFSAPITEGFAQRAAWRATMTTHDRPRRNRDRECRRPRTPPRRPSRRCAPRSPSGRRSARR